MRMKGSGLPDLPVLAEGILTMGFGARLRGVEVAGEGTLFEQDGKLFVRLVEGAAPLRLAPLTHRKVQWDHKKKRDHPRTPAEREAYARLLREWRASPRAVTVVGPLVEVKGKPPMLEVREFAWPDAPKPE
jgi:hypothetical protein